MKNNNRVTIIVALLLSISFFGCDDSSFLKETPDTFYTIDNVFSSADQVNQVITTCYVRVKNIYCPYDNSSELGVWSYSMGNGTDVFDVPTIRFSYRFNDYSILTSQTNVFYDTYAAFYFLINSANTALYGAAKKELVWDSEADKRWVVAQARFFRAFAYRNLGELFGGVPIVTEMASVPRYDYARSTRMETYQFAIDEMEAILNDIPEKQPIAGRLVKAVVQHNLCQLYIDKGVLMQESGDGDAKAAFQKALSYSDAVINSGMYQLMKQRFGSRATENPDFYFANSVAMQSSDHLYSAVGVGYPAEGNVYWDLFQEGNQDYQQGNTEAIWVAQCDYEVYKKQNGKTCLMYSGIYGPVFRDQGAPFLTGGMEDAAGFGMVQITPTPYSRDLVYDGKWKKDLRNSEAVMRRTFLGNEPSNEYYGKLIPWDKLYKKDANGKYSDAAYTMLYPTSCKIATDKYAGLEDGENRTRLFRDDYLIRLPETILLRAEIKIRLGDKAGAADDINKLRSRAQCDYLVTAADVTFDLILDERARELLYEESRWNTLLRMGGTVAVDRIKKYSYWDYPRTTLNKTFNVWPIPQTVIDTNKDVVLDQNPGWK